MIRRALVAALLVASFIARSARACPCSDLGLTFDDAEAKACSGALEMLRTYRASGNMSESGDRLATGILGGCLESFRTDRAIADKLAKDRRDHEFHEAAVRQEDRDHAAAQARTERAAAEEAEEREKRDAILSRDPKVMRPVLSGALCRNAIVRKDATEELAREVKYARRGGGIVNPAKIYSLQKKQRELDESTADVRKRLRDLKVTPLGCSVPSVYSAAVCLDDRDDEDCRDQEKEAAGVLALPYPWEKQEDGDY